MTHHFDQHIQHMCAANLVMYRERLSNFQLASPPRPKLPRLFTVLIFDRPLTAYCRLIITTRVEDGGVCFPGKLWIKKRTAILYRAYQRDLRLVPLNLRRSRWPSLKKITAILKQSFSQESRLDLLCGWLHILSDFSKAFQNRANVTFM